MSDIEQSGRLISPDHVKVEFDILRRQPSSENTLHSRPTIIKGAKTTTEFNVFDNTMFRWILYILTGILMIYFVFAAKHYDESVMYDHYITSKKSFVPGNLMGTRWPRLLAGLNGGAQDTSSLVYAIDKEVIQVGINPEIHGIVTIVKSHAEAEAADRLFQTCIAVGSKASFHVIFPSALPINSKQPLENAMYNYTTHRSDDPEPYIFGMSLKKVLYLRNDTIAVKNPDNLLISANPIMWACDIKDRSVVNPVSFAVNSGPNAYYDFSKIYHDYDGSLADSLFAMHFVGGFWAPSTVVDFLTYGKESLWFNQKSIYLISNIPLDSDFILFITHD
ncbi:hypothetical protein PCE1_003608 [Barthelona sp. PCE]